MRLFRDRGVTGEVLWLPELIVAELIAEANAWYPVETGGVLLGYESEDGLVVTDHVDAGPNAVRSRLSFAADAEYQLEEIARIYERSGRIHIYVGDWHSHPESSPTYSITDRAALREVSGSTLGRCERPLMLILGGSDPWMAVAWRYRRSRWWDQVERMRIRHY